MNNYLVPVCDEETGDIWIEQVAARSLEDAENKIIKRLTDEYEMDVADSWRDFVYHVSLDYKIRVGYEVKEIDEFL